MEFAKQLLKWYEVNQRDLPWRKTKDPYKIWLSEIILQQTQISQGLPYYNKFIKVFPELKDLALADEEKVLKLWQGLGYYSRARNLHFTAKYIIDELNAIFPDNYNSLLKLKGVGDYTASAIASFVYGECTPVVDGNVYRVLSRYFGIETPINSTKGMKEFKQLAKLLIDCTDPATYNQAIMDFGARQCKPKNPDCSCCPFSSTCVAFNKRKILSLPVKLKKIKIKTKYFNFLVCRDASSHFLFEKRNQNGIWKNLYQFPLIESVKPLTKSQLNQTLETVALFKNKSFKLSLLNQKQIIHKLTHMHIYARFWSLKFDINLSNTINYNEVIKKPMPILIKNFIESSLFLSEE